MERADDFLRSRGFSPDTRPMSEKPYSAISYCAQYGVPRDWAEAAAQQAETHGAMLMRIQREWLSSPEFREKALNWEPVV
jgi:hypothetical protein